MLPESLRVFTPDPHSQPVVASRSFQRHVAVGVNGVTRASQESLAEPAIWRKIGCQNEIGWARKGPGAALRDRLSGIPTDKEPLTGLSLELNDVLDVVIGWIVARVKIC